MLFVKKIIENCSFCCKKCARGKKKHSKLDSKKLYRYIIWTATTTTTTKNQTLNVRKNSGKCLLFKARKELSNFHCWSFWQWEWFKSSHLNWCWQHLRRPKSSLMISMNHPQSSKNGNLFQRFTRIWIHSRK